MSRTELYCPGCNREVMPSLMAPPLDYTCPGCGETVSRDSLKRLKVLHRHIAGVGSPPFDVRVLGSTSFYDASALTTVMTVNNCAVLATDLAIVCVGAGGISAAAQATVTIGGASMAQLQDPVGAGGGGDPDSDIYHKRTNTTGLKTVSITLSLPCSAGAALVLGVSGAKFPASNDQSNGAGATGTHFDSTATGALNAKGDFLVSVVSAAAASTSGPTRYPAGQGWTFIQRVGTAQSGGSPPDVFLDVAWAVAQGPNPVSATGDLALSAAWSAGIGAFLRA